VNGKQNVTKILIVTSFQISNVCLFFFLIFFLTRKSVQEKKQADEEKKAKLLIVTSSRISFVCLFFFLPEFLTTPSVECGVYRNSYGHLAQNVLFVQTYSDHTNYPPRWNKS
jgi:hypothetical protein